MIYITDDKEIYDYITNQHRPVNVKSEINLDVLLRSQVELVCIVNDRHSEDYMTSFNILVSIFDIYKNGCIPKIQKGDILIFKIMDNFSCSYF